MLVSVSKEALGVSANRSKSKLRMWAAVAVLAAFTWMAVPYRAAAQQSGTPSRKAAHKKHISTATRRSAAEHKVAATHTHSATHKSGGHQSRRTTRKRSRHHVLSAKARARSSRLQRAFVASSQLRPMAQQLAQMRTPAAYAGVLSYARSHTGEAASAAYLALGHAYLLDRKFPDAVSALKHVRGESLGDYADYLTIQAYLQSNDLPQAEMLLSSFLSKHPDSIFVNSVPVLEANLFLQEGDPQRALTILNAHRSEPLAGKVDYQFAMARAQQMAGNQAEAAALFRHVFLNYPLSYESGQAKTALQLMGAETALTVSERSHHADALYHAGRYSEADDEYRSLAGDPKTDGAERNLLLVAAAACDLKLKRLNKAELDALPDTNDESGARRLYLLMELARNKDDGDAQRAIVSQMETRFSTSPWLAEALYSSGNMYLLRKDYATAISYYGELARRFPRSCEPVASAGCSNYAPSSHWRAAWLNYRIGNYSEAARLFDEQIAVYHGGKEIPSALYWRARVYLDQEHRPDMAAEYFRTVARVYRHYYYAALAEQRLQELGNVTPANVTALDQINPAPVPELTDDVPSDDPHVVKAKLLANAGLNEYITPEIQAADGSREWGALAEAEIYASYGETWHAMRLMKRALPFYTSAPIDSIPLGYWRILFPQPYWPEIKEQAQKNGLDPYMVASLIRQETEFNPSAISNKSAYGLMQLLPSVGKSMARQEGIRHFSASELLNPLTNIRLGTLYLKQTLDKFDDQPEYAFAAYNAGDDRVTDWRSAGNFHGMDEFVESIPFTETREYVQAIVRNQQIYHELDKLTSERAFVRPGGTDREMMPARQ